MAGMVGVFVIDWGLIHKVHQTQEMTHLMDKNAVLNVFNRWTAKRTVGFLNGVAEQGNR